MHIKKFFLAFTLMAITTASCNHNAYKATNKVYSRQAKAYAKILKATPIGIDGKDKRQWIGTTNFNLRKPNFVIIHHTAQNSCDQTLRTFTLTRTQVSAHYVICKNGAIHHMLNDYLRAWHGGVAKWGSLNDINSLSIGIELDNNGFEYFTGPQMGSLLRLLDTLKTKYNIPAANFIGHGDIAPSRKNDPNYRFPWQQLATVGFGNWPGDTTGVILPGGFSNVQALRIIGYDVKDSTAAKLAFKRHYLADTTTGNINPGDQKLLYSLMMKSY